MSRGQGRQVAVERIQCRNTTGDNGLQGTYRVLDTTPEHERTAQLMLKTKEAGTFSKTSTQYSLTFV